MPPSRCGCGACISPRHSRPMTLRRHTFSHGIESAHDDSRYASQHQPLMLQVAQQGGFSSMSIWQKLAGVATGMVRSGPIGAFLGGNQEQDGIAEGQVAFTVGVIALGAKMAKADGIV